MPNGGTINKGERERRQVQSLRGRELHRRRQQSLRDREAYWRPQMTTTLPSFTGSSFRPARNIQDFTYQESTIISSDEHSESEGPSSAKNTKPFLRYYCLFLKRNSILTRNLVSSIVRSIRMQKFSSEKQAVNSPYTV